MTGVCRQADVFAQELLHGLVVPAQAFLKLVAQNTKVRHTQTMRAYEPNSMCTRDAQVMNAYQHT